MLRGQLGLLGSGLGLVASLGAAWAGPAVSPPPRTQTLVIANGLQLRVKRLPDAVELEIQNADLGSVMSQRQDGNTWVGELRTTQPRGLKEGVQMLAMPEAGMDRITFDGTGTTFNLTVVPTKNSVLPRPVISSDGRTMSVRFPAPQLPVSQVARPNLSQPIPVPTPTFVPPLRNRAVAPPLGDMAVGTMTLRNRGYINLSGPPVTLTARRANPRDILMVLAQMGGYGFAYSEQPPQIQKQGKEREPEDFENRQKVSEVTPVSVAFRNENFERAFNFVLSSAGLQARREGNTIMVGLSVFQQNFGPQVSKVYRLNQASPDSAADYLANLGTLVTKTFTETITATTGVPLSGAATTNPQTTRTSTEIKVQQYGGESGPLLGLRATTDTRLGTITLVGEGPLVAVAEQYLRQLDLRQRQVALSVRILDVNLNNDTDIDNSFALRYGNNFIVNDGGQLLAAFGRNLPARENEFEASTAEYDGSRITYNQPDLPNTYQYNVNIDSSDSASSSSSGRSGAFQDRATYLLDNSRSLTQEQTNILNTILRRETASQIVPLEGGGFAVAPISSPSSLANEPGRFSGTSSTLSGLSAGSLQRIDEIIRANTSSAVSLSRTQSGDFAQLSRSALSGRQTDLFASGVRRNPGLNYPDQQFFDFLRAQIVSENTKVLASPTLILQEGGQPNESSSTDAKPISSDGKIGRERSNEALVRVGTQLVTAYDVKQDALGNAFCQPVFGNAGLTFGAKVDKIDDNGFVTFSISPEISAQVGNIPAGNCGNVALVNSRALDTGQLRVRDGQTLILTGVISSTDRQVVSKWPILGDMPLIGQFFRRTSGARQKNELVIMVTPKIINDEQGGTYGYGYIPSTSDARRLVYEPVRP